jgi:Mn2+/Fe2+ NRAMP family transporter
LARGDEPRSTNSLVTGASQNLQGLLLPVVLVFMILLANDRRLMGDHRNGRVGNVLGWAAIGVVVVLDVALLGMAALGAVGIGVG